MASKYYAVRKGIKPGIYRTWDECKSMVHGFSSPEYKSFTKLEEAESFMSAASGVVGGKKAALFEKKNADDRNIINNENNGELSIYAFVDGSFNIATGVYGYGGFLVHDGIKEIIQGSGSDEEMASMRNVSGEVLGSMAAIKKAIELQLSEISIYYDYLGIEMWATGAWKRNKKGTIAYYDYINSVKDKIAIRFIKVKGHSGVDGNEEADKLAKQAVGIL